MTQQTTTPPGASLHLGGQAWASPDLEPLLVPITDVIPYPGNPRRHDQDNITASIRDLGLWAGCVTQASTDYCLVGNGRHTALLELGATQIPRTRMDVGDTRAAAIVARDNQTSDASTNDDAELLALLTRDEDVLALSGYGLEDLDELRRALAAADYTAPSSAPTLAERFVIPPFTVLDARSGTWQDRKQRWLSLGIQSEVGRGEGITTANSPDQHLAKIKPGLKGVLTGERGQRTLGQGLTAHRGPDGQLVYTETTAAGVSIFDPVLCELAYRWFCPGGGHVLDPFAGGSVRGIVAAALGRHYTGVELRPEQVAANETQRPILDRIRATAGITWLQGDSRAVLAHTTEGGQETPEADLVFSCPPYADLEVYSEDPADLSNMAYDQFLEAYRSIITSTCERLRDDRFAVWVVGEVRDRRGLYRNLVGDTIHAFTRYANLSYYNEAILITQVGSLPIRVGRQFSAGRKLGKTHQQVLVFCKGDPKAAAAACGTVEVTMPEVHDE